MPRLEASVGLQVFAKMTHHKKPNRVVRWIVLAVAVAFLVSGVLAVLPTTTSAQNATTSTSTPDLSGCQPVGDSTAEADVHVCGSELDGGSVVFDVYAREKTTVYVALVDGSATEGSVGTVERTLSAGSSTLREPAPSMRSVRYSIGNLHGFAFGEVGRTVDFFSAPTWGEFFASLSSAVAGVVFNVLIAVLIVLRGRGLYVNRLW